MTEQLTTETFKEKVYDYTKGQEWEYEGSLPCIIDFYADWCGPCKMIAPILEELSEEYDGKIKIYKINTEEQQELSQTFGIRSIPTLLFVPMGEEPQMSAGGMNKETLVKVINDILKI